MDQKISKFLKNLENCKAKFHWKMFGDGTIRAYKSESMFYPYCPITAVFRHKYKIPLPIHWMTIAGRLMGLSEDKVGFIVSAADNNKPTDEIREGIIKAVGLKI